MDCNSPHMQLSPAAESKPAESDPGHTQAQKRKAVSPPPTENDVVVSPKRNKVADGGATTKDAPDVSSQIPKDRGADRSADRRQSASQEERRRGKRLYGSLLNTLSQTTTNSQQKRRQEIERRQQAKVSQQRVEDDKQRQEKLSRLNSARKVEQIKFDEQVVRQLLLRAITAVVLTRHGPDAYQTLDYACDSPFPTHQKSPQDCEYIQCANWLCLADHLNSTIFLGSPQTSRKISSQTR